MMSNGINWTDFSIIQGFLDCLDVGISIFDAKGAFLFVNRYVLNASGRSRSDYLGKTVDDFRRMGILDNPVISEVIATKQPSMRVQRSRTKNGVVKEFLVRGYPILDEEGEILFMVADRIEMSPLYQQYIELRKSATKIDRIQRRSPYEEDGIVCASPEMSRVLDMAAQVSISDATVLLQGESGTGKEVVANFIHEKSHRNQAPMVQINCASMPENLLESELFGYEKGSFTGALSTGKEGLIEAANHGTLFLDEVNSMPLSLQAKLLRVLETKTILRIGSLKPRGVDFRLITATNADLKKCVEEHTFREDLYYRLNVIPIEIPPLRNRREDIIPLGNHFLELFCKKYGVEKQLAPKIYRTMEIYSWPGNVRELRNFIERLVVMSVSSAVRINNLPPGMLDLSEKDRCDYQIATKESRERERIIRALEKFDGHRQKTAEYLGISRRCLQYKLKKFGLLK